MGLRSISGPLDVSLLSCWLVNHLYPVWMRSSNSEESYRCLDPFQKSIRNCQAGTLKFKKWIEKLLESMFHRFFQMLVMMLGICFVGWWISILIGESALKTLWNINFLIEKWSEFHRFYFHHFTSFYFLLKILKRLKNEYRLLKRNE